MSKHTKGPWKYHKSYCQQGKKPLTICDDDGMPVAGISGSSMRQSDPEANARLISAAPELLEVLTQFLELKMSSCVSQTEWILKGAVIAKATAIIAKATGEMT